jgi:hypothetical protein
MKNALVFAIVVVLGTGQSLSAQMHPSVFSPTEATHGPLARATAAELARLERSGPVFELTRDGRAINPQALRGEAGAVAARQSRRGVIGAVIGAAAGALLGVGLAIGYATRDCGSSCTDERAMIGVSLIGIPVAGGLAGYYIAK